MVALIFILALLKFGFESMTAVREFFKEDKSSIIVYNNYENCTIINN